MSPRAPLRTLARRVCFDLTGLPPSPERLDALVRDARPDAYALYVDELLASEAYGERWARHWLDVVRFGESNGFEYNEPRRHAWHYRDWVIDALNKDMPYDEFVRSQLAGDDAAALGFLVAGVHNTVLGATDLMKRQARADELEEIVGTLSQAFLGITAQCARCHDHKVDPVPTEEYYRLAASISGVNFGDAASQSVYTVVSGDPGVMRVHLRGSAGELGEEVTPGGISAIRGLSAEFGLDAGAADPVRRTKLARWITDPNNPLFVRVIVNRVWHYHFGTGIVATPNDLGRSGGHPSHPELLDWLALRFREDGYSLKRLHRLIVISDTYCQSSAVNADALVKDSESRLLWRFPPRRIEAEAPARCNAGNCRGPESQDGRPRIRRRARGGLQCRALLPPDRSRGAGVRAPQHLPLLTARRAQRAAGYLRLPGSLGHRTEAQRDDDTLAGIEPPE